MNYFELHRTFKVLYDELDSEVLPDLYPEVIDVILNLATERFINRVYNSYMENKERGLVEVQTLISPLSITSFNLIRSDFEKEYEAYLPIDFLYNLEENLFCSVICKDKAIKKRLEVVNTKNLSVSNTYINPFKKANSNKVLRTILQNKYNFITDLITTPVELTGKYLKKPRKVDFGNQIDLDVPDNSHYQIVQEAVNIALETVQSPRFQSQSIINKTN